MVEIAKYKHAKYLVSVDCIIFGYEDGVLKLLLFKRKIEPAAGQWSLVGGWVNPEESLENAATRVLKGITGLTDIYMEQVKVFSDPKRDPGGQVISTAFYALIPIDQHDKCLVEEHGAYWVAVDKLPKLIFDHDEMVKEAFSKLRLISSLDLFGIELLPECFTLLQLRKLYQAIYQKEFDAGNFRKKVLSLKRLQQLDIKDTASSKKGAFYYRVIPNTQNNTGNRIVNYLP